MDKKLIICILITLAYAVFTLIGVLHHEIWADEAQVWQLCKYLSFSELFHHLHNEGHPALFYLLVMPFAKLSSNIIFMQLICWGVMCFASFLLLYKAPFNMYAKIAILLSAGFIYFFPVIARSYSILPFLVFAAAILYSKQKEHPILYALIIAAIADTHAIMFCFSFILASLFLYDNVIKDKLNIKKYIIPLFIMAFGLLYVVWQLHDTSTSNCYITLNFEDLLLKFSKIVLFFFINSYDKLITLNSQLERPLIDLPMIVILAAIFILMFKNLYLLSKRFFWIAFLSIGFQIGIYLFGYNAHIYVIRIFSAYIILIFCLWVGIFQNCRNDKESEQVNGCVEHAPECTDTKNNEKTLNKLIALFFIITSYNGLNFYNIDLHNYYAPPKETYEFIKNNIDKNDIIMTDSEIYDISLINYMEKDKLYDNIFSLTRNKKPKYIIWDEGLPFRIDNEDWVKYAKSLRNQGFKNDIYVLIGYDNERENLDADLTPDFDLVFKSENFYLIMNEKHSIYKYKH